MKRARRLAIQSILHSMGFLILVSAAFLQAAPAAPAEAPPASKLIAAAIEAQRVDRQRGWKYTYREDHDQFHFDKNGERLAPTRKTYDAIMLEAETYRKLILIDGKPPSEKIQKQVERDLEKTRAERRKRSIRSITRTIPLGGLDELQRLFENKVTGEEIVRGRNTWRVESEPKPGIKPANKREEQEMSARHTTWFDRQEGMIVKERILFLREAKGFQPGCEIDNEYVKIGDAWLMDLAIWKGEMKALAVMHLRFESHQHYFDYKRFDVESTIAPQ